MLEEESTINVSALALPTHTKDCLAIETLSKHPVILSVKKLADLGCGTPREIGVISLGFKRTSHYALNFRLGWILLGQTSFPVLPGPISRINNH